jgi:phage baseplate assembly protein W
MDAGRLLGRGISFPPRIGPDGRVALSEGADNVREAIRVVLMTDRGERVMLQPFGGGLRGFLFEPNIPATHRLVEERIAFALGRWEPRIAVSAVVAQEDPGDDRRALVTISYALVATQEQGEVTVAVPLTG